MYYYICLMFVDKCWTDFKKEKNTILLWFDYGVVQRLIGFKRNLSSCILLSVLLSAHKSQDTYIFDRLSDKMHLLLFGFFGNNVFPLSVHSHSPVLFHLCIVFAEVKVTSNIITFNIFILINACVLS